MKLTRKQKEILSKKLDGVNKKYDELVSIESDFEQLFDSMTKSERGKYTISYLPGDGFCISEDVGGGTVYHLQSFLDNEDDELEYWGI